jgi:CRP-like cAMP-binding protein
MTTQAGVAPAINFILILQTQRGIFDGVDAEHMVYVQRRLGHQTFGAGAIVLAQGDLPRWLYIIESGSAELLATDESGTQKRAWQVGTGEIFGEGFLLTGRPAATTVRAVTDLHVAVIEHTALRELAETFPVISEPQRDTRRSYRLSQLLGRGRGTSCGRGARSRSAASALLRLGKQPGLAHATIDSACRCCRNDAARTRRVQ